MPYSPVTQPLPLPLRNEGTPASTVAVQITRVWPTSIRTLPSATGTKSGVKLTGRIWSGARPSFRKAPPQDRITIESSDRFWRANQAIDSVGSVPGVGGPVNTKTEPASFALNACTKRDWTSAGPADSGFRAK